MILVATYYFHARPLSDVRTIIAAAFLECPLASHLSHLRLRNSDMPSRAVAFIALPVAQVNNGVSMKDKESCKQPWNIIRNLKKGTDSNTRRHHCQTLKVT